MMKRTKGVTLDEIMEATGWQKHTVRGFVSILGSKAVRRSNPPRMPPGSARIASRSNQLRTPNSNAALGCKPGRRRCL
jgi:hypothetical protein